MRRLPLTLAMLGLLAMACDDGAGSDDAGPPGSTDAGPPGSTDAGPPGSTDAGPPGSSDAGPPATDAGPPGPATIPIVAAVGWQGLRMLSIDEGETWCEVGLMVDGHDDLFRGGGYHDGLFVGAHAGEANRGAIWTSTNGYEWTALHRTNEDASLPVNPSGQWYGGAAYGNGRWIAAGGCGRMATSTDGRTWTDLPRFTDGCLHIRSLAFYGGEFVAGLDDDNWYSSSDGATWAVMAPGAGSFVVALDSGLSGPVHGRNFYQGRGVCLAGFGSPNFGIERSTAADCSGATRVADTPARLTTFLFGEAPEADFTRARTGEALADCLGLP